MAELSASCLERARKNETMILRKMADIGQSSIAVKMGVDESTISKMKEGRLQSFANMMAACGLKVVPEEYNCLDPIKAKALFTLYQSAISRVSDPVELLWGDE